MYSMIMSVMCAYSICHGASYTSGSEEEFTAEMVEAYKYVFSQPGAITAPLNYYRCILKGMNMKMGSKKIEVPILIIWVSSREGWTLSHINVYSTQEAGIMKHCELN
jgi:hypothetical protein